MPEGVAAKALAAVSTPANKQLIRWMLFVYALLVVCPIRVWPVDGSLDNTWVFALNYAASHGLALGRDVVWTTGPLGYLVFPQNQGSNLARALVFQIAAWGGMGAIFWDLFFRRGMALRNVGFWSIFLGLSAPLFWFNYMGLENILLVGLLVLLGIARQRESRVHFLIALVVAGIVPLIKSTAGMLAAGAIAGYLLDLALQRKWAARQDFVWAALLPVSVFGLICRMTLPTWEAFAQYLRASVETAAGYSASMSASGDPIEFAAVAEILVWIGVLLFFVTRAERPTGIFLAAVLAIPAFVSFKHGFVRQDVHVLNFVCFGAVAIGMILLFAPLNQSLTRLAVLSLIGYGVLWLEYVGTQSELNVALAEASGIRPLTVMMGLPKAPPAAQASALDPAIRGILKTSPTGFLSVSYGLAVDSQLNLKLSPVIQTYAAYTPYLDGRNARWVKESGPQFLIYDWSAIDGRHPWAQCPATWMEVYRWYDTRLLTLEGTLLMERRGQPRFGELVEVRRFDQALGLDLELPWTDSFWAVRCTSSSEGRFRKLMFRVPEVSMTRSRNGLASTSRVLPEVLVSALPAASLPDSVEELAALLDPRAGFRRPDGPRGTKIRFGGPGLGSFGKHCEVEVMQPGS